MKDINIIIDDGFKILKDSGRLSKILKYNLGSAKFFNEAINNFLEEFNKRYRTDVSFKQVLDIFEDKNNLSFYQTLILCKALLDFIQNNGIEITFEGNKNIIRYSTLANSNVILEYNPLFGNNLEILNGLSIIISSFIEEIRTNLEVILGKYIRLDNLQELDIRDLFIDNSKALLGEYDKVADGSVKISEGLVIPYEKVDKKLIFSITKLTNDNLKAFLDFIYNNIPEELKSGNKVTDLISIIGLSEFSEDSSFLNSIKNVFDNENTINSATIKKFDIDKIRYYLFGLKVKKIENISEETPEEKSIKKNTEKKSDIKPDNLNIINTVGEKSKINEIFISGNILTFTDGSKIDLDKDNYFEDISNLSKENAQQFFLFLEKNVIKRFNITKSSVAKKIAELIELSSGNHINIRQKIINLRKSLSKITPKFLNKNIDALKLNNLILSFEKNEEENTSIKPENIKPDNLNITNTVGEKSKINEISISGNILTFTDLSKIDLDKDNYFEDISNLSKENAQQFFLFLEKNVIKVFNINRSSVAKKIAELIKLSSDKNSSNIKQKIINLRKSPSNITIKFLNKNINGSKLKDLILNFEKNKEENTNKKSLKESNIDKIEKKEKKEKGGSFEISFYDDLSEEEINMDVNYNGKKNLEGFTFALNSFVLNYFKKVNIESSVQEFKEEDFEGILLDSDFIDNLKIKGENFNDLFDIFNEEILDNFLIEWSKKSNKKLKEPKEKYIKAGSKEEVKDFFSFLKKLIRKDLITQKRKGGSNSNNKSKSREKSLTITDDMINEFENIALELFDTIPQNDDKWKGILSRYNKERLKEIVDSYIIKRKEINKRFKKSF